MKPIGEILKNIRLATDNPVVRGGFTQVPNFILKDATLCLGAKVAYAMFSQLREHKGQEFPCSELFQIYRDRLHFFTDEITDQTLGKFDQQFLFYLLYDGARVVRQQDVDHIHPKSILSQRGVSEERINSLPNFQLIDTTTNRGVKNDSELRDWIDGHVTERKVYLTRHLIPQDEALWVSAEFDRFHDARQKLVIHKLQAIVAG